MKKWILLILLIVGCYILQSANNQKIIIKKKSVIKKNHKIHPVEEEFRKKHHHTIVKDRSKSRNFNKLLVLLIDFQEDDNSQTTGNGKFIQDPDDYPIDVGRPPHNKEFFLSQLEAMRYYYLAVSMNQYDLEYDVFPNPDTSGNFRAYTLPQNMEYYNQINSSPELMVERFEEYFTDAFQKADEDPEIDFSQYEHYMFIHAGSDWQHDIKGDSTHDMPSFFIRVGEGKEVIVDDNFVIDHACNIPEMITQDVEINETTKEISNCGVINAVMAHEFGHSLGFVDLYNVNNFRPAVGVFDIMDSGGSGLIGDTYIDTNGEEYVFFLEGGLPALPSIWSRLLVESWKEHFIEQGYYKTIDQIDFDSDITINPAESQPSIIGDSETHFLKIPFTDKEYLLLENRQVDPDGDGGIHVKGDLAITPDDEDNPRFRVLLHPIYTTSDTLSPNYLKPNYEYDFLLPGWQDTGGNFLGGGLLVWQIDENVIYRDDNFENNRINTRYSDKGVKIVEADDIEDIGNPYSYFWQGTAYEAYFKYMPTFNENGLFTGWDDSSIPNSDGEIIFTGHYANYSLSSTSKPALQTKAENPGFYKIYDISSIPINPLQERIMSFKIGSNLFDHTMKIISLDSLVAIGGISKSVIGYPSFIEFPTVNKNEFNLYYSFFTETDSTDSWHLYPNNFPLDLLEKPTLPISVFNYDDDSFSEYLISQNNMFSIVNSGGLVEEKTYESYITESPLYFSNYSGFVVSTEEKLYIGEKSYEIPVAKVTSDGTNIFAVSDNKYFHISSFGVNSEIMNEVVLPKSTGNFKPICYKDTLQSEFSRCFVQSIDGDAYSIKNNEYERIFSADNYSTGNCTQLALGKFTDNDQIHLAFGIEDRVFVLDIFGNLLSGFPKILDENILLESFPKIITMFDDNILFINTLSNSIEAFDFTGKERSEFSFRNVDYNDFYHFFWEESSERLNYIYSDESENSDSSHVYSSYISDVQNDPIIWNGWRNNAYSLYEGTISAPLLEENFAAYAFPNPAKEKEVRIRVLNASEKINVKIYDIAGHKLFSKKIDKEPTLSQDVLWDISNISSGVYFGIVKCGDKIKKVPIAIEK
ncbi:MAG: T9SS type A sorting domain-containing protein [Candidatus Cloacimonetes bacterium]|nr:T9SS type A sorting domain-containing protein [Candidatus Cloacimonadota bacterium]